MSSSLRTCLLLIALLFTVASAAFMPVSSSHSRAASASATTTTRSSTRIWGSPAVLERESTGTGPAILERPFEVATPQRTATNEPTRDRKQQGNEAWEVRIYNDGLNTREHVARSLVQVTGLTEMFAYQTMMQAHQNGIAVVGRWAFEIAEMFHDELKGNGIVCDLVPVEEEK